MFKLPSKPLNHAFYKILNKNKQLVPLVTLIAHPLTRWISVHLANRILLVSLARPIMKIKQTVSEMAQTFLHTLLWRRGKLIYLYCSDYRYWNQNITQGYPTSLYFSLRPIDLGMIDSKCIYDGLVMLVVNFVKIYSGQLKKTDIHTFCIKPFERRGPKTDVTTKISKLINLNYNNFSIQ